MEQCVNMRLSYGSIESVSVLWVGVNRFSPSTATASSVSNNHSLTAVMSRLKVSERIEIVELYYENGRSASIVQRKWSTKYGRHCRIPERRTINNIVKRFQETGSVLERHRSGRPSNETDAGTVKELILENPSSSLRQISKQVGCSVSFAHNVCRRMMKLYPYRVQLRHALKPDDQSHRVLFCQWVRDMVLADPNFLSKIFFSDEAHFWLNGYVNSQNYRIWGSENPHASVPKSLHGERLTVWVAISEQRLVGPFFRTENIDQRVYRSIIQDDFLPALQAAHIDVSTVWFQQDNATPHTATATMKLLHSIFGSRLISKDPRWPPRSPDLAPNDFWLFGYLKDVVYRDGVPPSLSVLQSKIQDAVSSITQDVLQRVICSFDERVDACLAMNGEHFSHVLC